MAGRDNISMAVVQSCYTLVLVVGEEGVGKQKVQRDESHFLAGLLYSSKSGTAPYGQRSRGQILASSQS